MSKHIEKLLISLLVLCLCVSLSGCEKSSNSSTTAVTEENSENEAEATIPKKTTERDDEVKDENQAETKVEPTGNEVSTKLTKDDIAKYVTGLDDTLYVLKGAVNPNYLSNVKIDDQSVVSHIGIRKGAVDTSKTGEYEAKIIVTLDAEAFMKAKGEAIKGSNVPKCFVLQIPTTVQVVTNEEADDLSSKGISIIKGVETENKKGTKDKSKDKKKNNSKKSKDNNSESNSDKTRESSTSDDSHETVDESSKEDSSVRDDSRQDGDDTSKKPQESSQTDDSKKKDDSSKPSGGSDEPSKPAHKHTWVEQTKTIYHDEEGHYENVVVEEAWDEPEYEEKRVYECYCGAQFDSKDEVVAHCDSYDGAEDDVFAQHSGYSKYWIEVQIGTIHHDAVKEKQWVVDSEGWEETVVTGYKCSGCGATK